MKLANELRLAFCEWLMMRILNIAPWVEEGMIIVRGIKNISIELLEYSERNKKR